MITTIIVSYSTHEGRGRGWCKANLDGNAPSFSQNDDNTVGGYDISAVDLSGRTPVRFGDVDFVGSRVTFFWVSFLVFWELHKWMRLIG